MFDVCGHQTANYIQSPDFRRVRNEADPEKWLPGDPFGPATAPFDEKDIQTIRRWLKEAELAVQVDYVRSGGAGYSYLVRDYDSFEDLVLTKREPVPPSWASVFDVYCGPHFTLQGIVDESFIGRTEAAFPDPGNLWIIDPRPVYPERIGFHEGADSVEEVSSVLRGLIGEYVAVGPYPGDESRSLGRCPSWKGASETLLSPPLAVAPARSRRRWPLISGAPCGRANPPPYTLPIDALRPFARDLIAGRNHELRFRSEMWIGISIPEQPMAYPITRGGPPPPLKQTVRHDPPTTFLRRTGGTRYCSAPSTI
jgi:hypothetical protein